MVKKGSNECFTCGREVKWKIVKFDWPGQVITTDESDGVDAEEIAIEKGTYEILAVCPNCGTKNKFIQKDS